MSQKLQVTSYPFLGILMANSQSPTLVARIEGITQLESILEILNTTYDRYSPILISDRHDATTQNLARQQREQQDREYQEALEADRKREEELKEAERLKLLEEERKIREEQEKLEQLNQLSNLKSELRKKFFDENGQLIQISKDVDTCLIRFRFPNGTTLQRNFKKTDSVNLLYELVFSLKTPNAPWETSESTTLDKIELSTTFPKKILNRSLTIEQEKCANETLLVREDI